MTRGMLPSLVLIAVAAFYLVASFAYDPATRAMPLGVAALAIALLAVEILSRTQGRLGRSLARVLQGGGTKAPVPGLDGQAGQAHPPRKELAAFAWILAFLGLVVVFGFYIAIPIYVAAYLYVYARKGVLPSLGTALTLTAALYAMFELLLGYEVFTGLITGDFM